VNYSKEYRRSQYNGKQLLENTEGAIKNGQSRETDWRGQYIIRRENKTIPVTHKIKEDYRTTDRK